MTKLDISQLAAFTSQVDQYYNQHGRNLPWRQAENDGHFDAYKILVSEIMLQQTQVSRVIPKFEKFIALFPTVEVLAEAPLAAVIKAWSGLGYNRRAKFLWEAAQKLASQPEPWNYEQLVALKGIGSNTAAAVLVYSYNYALVFIETNIRTVYIYHFFVDREAVSDSELLPIIHATLDQKNPRGWFWALMDYGSFVKSTVGNLSRRSNMYAKQSPFQGSVRQLRGEILRHLSRKPHTSVALQSLIHDERLNLVLATLVREELVKQKRSLFCLPS